MTKELNIDILTLNDCLDMNIAHKNLKNQSRLDKYEISIPKSFNIQMVFDHFSQ